MVTRPGSSVGLANGMSRVPALVGGTFLWTSFSLLTQLLRCRMFFQTFLDMDQGALGVLGGLDLPLHSAPSCKPHSCSCVVLYCAYLQELEQRCLAWKNDALLPHGSLRQPHLVLSHGVLLPTILVCLLPTILGWLHSHLAIMFETGTLSHYPLGF